MAALGGANGPQGPWMLRSALWFLKRLGQARAGLPHQGRFMAQLLGSSAWAALMSLTMRKP